MYDVIVVGSGPSGSMAAKTCADNGLKVLLLEKESLPRYKTCGGAVSKKALDLIGPLEGLEPKYDIFGARMFTPSLDSLKHKFKDPVTILTFRDPLDNFLVQNAKASGTEIHENEKVEKVDIREECVEVKTTKGSYSAKVIIGADGATSLVAKEAKLRKRWKKSESAICIEAEIELEYHYIEKLIEDEQLIYFYFIEDWGYGWIFPKGNVLSVGIGGMRERIQNLSNSFSNFLNLISNDVQIDLEEHIIKKSGHLIPAGGFDRDIFTDRVLLVGDAAGFVDPFLGEGIYYALASGIKAGEVATQSIKRDDQSKEFLSLYRKKCDEMFDSDLKFALKFAKTVYKHLDFFFYLLKVDPYLYEMYLLTGKGDYSYKEYSQLALKRMPITLLKILRKAW